MSDSMDRKSSRKWQITINNPLEKGLDHETIKQIMSGVKGDTLYWCMCDEEGDECETLHTHVFIYRTGAFTARQINNLFPNCHRETCHGTCAENRAYVFKDGEKFNKQPDGHYHYVDKSGKEHDGINFSDTFFEFGKCPEEHQGKSTGSMLVLEMIKDGASNMEVLNALPSYFEKLDKLDRVRSLYRDQQFANSWRDLHVVYIFGKTGTGKTRFVMETYGYENVYRVTDYKHPFDTYDGQDVILFEEFRGGIKHGDMLNYLDGYPLLLPCRYFNRQACYTKVYINSNIPPDVQYLGVDDASRQAFFRRIHEVMEYDSSGHISRYDSVYAYVHRYDWVKEAESAVEFSQIKENYEQLSMR